MWKLRSLRALLVAVAIVGCGDQTVAPKFKDNQSAKRDLDFPGGYCGEYANPGGGSIIAGQTVEITAYFVDCTYGSFTPNTGFWTSSAPSVLSVSGYGGYGSMYAASPGTATISYWEGLYYVQATFTVVAFPVLTSMQVSAYNSITLGGTGNTAQLYASGKDQYNQAIATGTVTWSTSDASIATVSSSGAVTFGSGIGTATITATVGSLSATIEVTANVLYATLLGWNPNYTMTSPGTIDFSIDALGVNSSVTYQWYFTDWTSTRQTLGTNYYQAITPQCSGAGITLQRSELVEVDITYMGSTTHKQQWLNSEYLC